MSRGYIQVPARLDAAATAAQQNDRQIVVVVAVAVADAAAVHHHAVVQQRPLPFRGRGELLDQVGEQLDVVPVDLGDLLLLLVVVAVMRQVVMAFARRRFAGNCGCCRRW